MGVTAVRLLSSLGLLVIIVQAQNCSRPVGGDNMDLKGDNILLKEFPNGIKVTFACNTGYVPVKGPASIVCRSGSWSALGLQCERKSCGAADEVEHGQIVYQPGNLFGDKAVVICNIGYLQVGKGSLSCEVEGWKGRLPVCEVVTCDAPPVVMGGYYSPIEDTYEYNEVIQYTCKGDYTINGTEQLSCSQDGTFRPDPPQCIKVRCEEPEIPNGFWSGGARPPYGYLSAVTFECNPGYTMDGNAVQKCDINSQWEPGLPSCTLAEDCADPRKFNPKVTVSQQPPYKQWHKVTLGCPSGHKLGGQSTITCGKNGVWDQEIPDCKTDNSGSGVLIPVLSTFLVLVVVALILIGMRCYGVAPFKRKTKGKRCSPTTTELLKVETAS